TATVAFSRRRLAGLLRDFQALNPGLRIHLDATDAVVNLIDGGFDLAIRIGALPDSSLIARQIAPSRRVIVASPAYLEARGRPRT
ncbi:LysR substrate-binding domain-containing protein, partial [Salmonella enterica]|uniref:LysR substrate-binding domain-containing protein n=1 Tax=Salmonella enterica TaxID=28901 RepID=UPI003D2B1510